MQQAALRFPFRHDEGAEQTIAFPPLPAPAAGAASVPLAATSSSGLPVFFYVREGPAVLGPDGRTLVFTPVPPRARRPVKITVVAWQWGRAAEPKLRSAASVERTLLLGA